MMKMNYSEMSNSELRLQIEKLRNMFENKRNTLKNICEEMNDIEKEYFKVVHELNIRKNLYI